MTFNLNYNSFDLNPTNSITVNRLGGINGLEIRGSRIDKTLADGGILFGTYNSARNITIDGSISAPTADEYFSIKRQLIDAFSNSQESRALTITTWESAPISRILNCRVMATPMIVEQSGNISNNSFRIELYSEDPFFLGDTLITDSTGLPIAGGLDLAADLPASFSASTPANIIINNTGDVSVLPTYTITCGVGVTNPRVSNLSTGESFYFDDSFSAGDVLVVSKDAKGLSVTKNGANAIGIFKGEYLEVGTGNSTIAFSANSYDAVSELEISYRLRYDSL